MISRHTLNLYLWDGMDKVPDYFTKYYPSKIYNTRDNQWYHSPYGKVEPTGVYGFYTAGDPNAPNIGLLPPGGLTGQHLVKVSDADYDAVWVDEIAEAAGSPGEVQFNENGVLATDDDFYWDNVNKNLGLGTSIPKQRLDIIGVVKAYRYYASFDGLIGTASFYGRTDNIYPVFDGYQANPTAQDVAILSAVAGTANLLRLRSDDVDRVVVKNNGNMGLGTTTPSEKLEVVGKGYFNDTSKGSGTNRITIRKDIDGTEADRVAEVMTILGDHGFITRTESSLGWGNQANFNIVELNADDSEDYRVTVKAGGNVGIGTTTPIRNLVISNGGAQGIEIRPYDNDKYADILAYDRNLSESIPLRFSASEFNFETGVVGIGTSTPSEKLEVAGNVKATAFIGDGSQLTGVGSASSGIYWSGTIDASGNITTQEGTGVGTVTTSYNGSTYYRVNHNLDTQNYRVFATAYAGGRTQGSMVALPSMKSENYVDLYPVSATDVPLTATLDVMIVKL